MEIDFSLQSVYTFTFRDLLESFTLLSCNFVLVGSFLLMFWDSISVQVPGDR